MPATTSSACAPRARRRWPGPEPMRTLIAGLCLLIGLWLGLAVVPILRDRVAPPPPVPVTVAARGELAADEAATIALFEAASPAVVAISTTARDPFRRGVEVPRGAGSGFVWDGRGHIVNNAHVIAGATAATVQFADGRARPARLVGLDRRHDLAVLRVGDATARPLPLGMSGDLRVGQKVFAIGNPFGLDQTLTTGIVSALNREVPGEGGATIRGAIQTDAAINPGNSGGPLLDSAGRLIGVNTAIYSPSGASAGIGFAVPVDAVARVVPQLIARGRYAPPTLGVSGDPRADVLLRGAGQGGGMLVLDVTAGGPADRAGIEGARMTARGLVAGDVIEAVDGVAVDGIEALLGRLDEYAPGDRVSLTLRRADRRREVDVVLEPGS